MSTGDASSSDRRTARDDSSHAERAPEEPASARATLRQLEAQFEELTEFALYYVSARFDLARLTLKRGLVLAAVALIALAVLVALVAGAAVIGLLGLAGLLSELFGGRMWAGYLTAGFGLLALLAIGGYLFLQISSRRSRESIIERYAQRRHEQKARFGHDVKEQAHRAQQAERQ